MRGVFATMEQVVSRPLRRFDGSRGVRCSPEGLVLPVQLCVLNLWRMGDQIVNGLLNLTVGGALQSALFGKTPPCRGGCSVLLPDVSTIFQGELESAENGKEGAHQFFVDGQECKRIGHCHFFCLFGWVPHRRST